MVRRLSVVTVLALALGCLYLAAAGAFGPTQSVWAEESAPAKQTVPININTASVEELATLQGFGEKTAQAIVAYREANGLFVTAEDIMKVKGVGKKKYEVIKGQITATKPKHP